MLISIITPVYNRAKYLMVLAHSISTQNVNCLDRVEWIIVDDGSTDNIEQEIESILDKYKKLNIKYISKSNGGKHTAVNEGLMYCQGDYVMIVDSDDYLVEGALVSLLNVITNQEYEVYAFLDLKSNTGRFTNEIYNVSEFIFVGGDRVFVVKTEVFKRNLFPIHENEKFVTESTVWNKLIDSYGVRCFNQPVVSGEYLDGGLTFQYLNLLKHSPLGVFDLVYTNQHLKQYSIPIIKQTAYHFSAIFSVANIATLFKKEPFHKNCILVLATVFVLIKKRLKNRCKFFI